ncbi:hypothetical protein NUACC26_046480 [Scytonema sp. NUACC26]
MSEAGRRIPQLEIPAANEQDIDDTYRTAKEAGRKPCTFRLGLEIISCSSLTRVYRS